VLCCRPSWFEKYRNAAGSQPGRTIIYFAADRSAVAAGSFQDQQARGFASAFYGLTGSVSFAGYEGYLSRKVTGTVSPGIAAAKHLLNGGAVNAYTAGGATAVDSLTGAKLRSYTYRASLLFDRCRLICNGLVCPPPPPCGAKEASCNLLSGTCDTSCCNKQDDEQCTLRAGKAHAREAHA
jgi:hypothetical protein